MCHVAEVNTSTARLGSIAQLGEHMPYKHGVTGSSPVVPTISGPVVQSVSTPACHAGGRRFESVPGRHFYKSICAESFCTTCLCSSVGRAEDVQSVSTPACHAGGRRFESVPGRHFYKSICAESFCTTCLCSSVGRAEDGTSSCRWFESDRRHQMRGELVR